MERGAKRKICQKGRWVEVCRDAGRGQWKGKIVFINLYLFRECWPRARALQLQHPVLYSHWLFGHWAAHKSNWGLSAVHRGTLTTVIKAVSSLLFTSPCQIFQLCLCHKAACLHCRLVPPQQCLHRACLEQFIWPLRCVLFKGFFFNGLFFMI